MISEWRKSYLKNIWVPPSIQHSEVFNLSQSGVKRNFRPSKAPGRVKALPHKMVRMKYGNMAENQMI